MNPQAVKGHIPDFSAMLLQASVLRDVGEKEGWPRHLCIWTILKPGSLQAARAKFISLCDVTPTSAQEPGHKSDPDLSKAPRLHAQRNGLVQLQLQKQRSVLTVWPLICGWWDGTFVLFCRTILYTVWDGTQGQALYSHGYGSRYSFHTMCNVMVPMLFHFNKYCWEWNTDLGTAREWANHKCSVAPGPLSQSS